MRRRKTWMVRMSLLGLALLVGATLILLTLPPAFGQEAKEAEPQKPWTGKLADGREITQPELVEILKANPRRIFNYSIKYQKYPSDLWIDLSNADLNRVNLSGVFSQYVNVNKASLYAANLRKTQLWDSDLRGANFRFADLSGATILGDLSGAILMDANLSEASFGEKLIGTNFENANLNKAWFKFADLSGANFFNADLTGTTFFICNLRDTIFEPKPGLPDLSHWMVPKGLSSLTYKISPHALMELREIFKKGGQRDNEREITFALNHNRRIKLWETAYFNSKYEYEHKQDLGSNLEKILAKIESLFQLVCFEWTCGYGLYPGRPLKIMGLGLLFFTVPYLLALGARKPETGLWVVLLPDRVLDKNIKEKPIKLTFENPFLPPPEGRGIRFRSTLPRFLRVLWVGLHFSLISAFSLGWRELNVGNWITRIQKQEYTLRATGWVRSVAGIQSLLSIYLLALWVLSYFGRPFD